MLLPAITQAISRAPRHIAGVSFSDRSIRYVEVEKSAQDILTISTYGHLTIPYDVVEGNKVINMVEFTEVLRKLHSYIHPQARIVIREDGDEAKAEAFSYAGYNNVVYKSGLDALRGVFMPWGADAQRVCIFANYDATYVLKVTATETTLLKKFTKDEWFAPGVGALVRSYLESASNQEIIVAGKYVDETYLDQLNIYKIKFSQTNIWQNLFDFSKYVPEIPQEDSYEYTVPAGLVVSGLMQDLPSATRADNSSRTQAPITNTNNTNVEKPSPTNPPTKETHKKINKTSRKKQHNIQPTDGLAHLLSGVEPLTKLDEDKRKTSEKKMSKKYTKHLDTQ